MSEATQIVVQKHLIHFISDNQSFAVAESASAISVPGVGEDVQVNGESYKVTARHFMFSDECCHVDLHCKQ